MKTTREIHDAFVMHTYLPGATLARGEGMTVWDDTGREYLDFTAGIAVCQLGHAHPAVAEALYAQAKKLIHCSNLFVNENQPRLAEKLAHLSGLEGKCFFANSGAEANECLIKLARKWGAAEGRYEIITMRNSFHGRTLATLAATGQEKYRKDFGPDMPGFVYADYNHLDSIAAAITPRTVAILCEAIQGEGGVIPAAPGFLQALRKLCDDHNLLLFFDEVQCGIGRTGKWFGFQNMDVQPDAFSLAKALANGVPIGAAVAAPRLADVLQPGTHASTFGGNPLACAAALATLETIESQNLVAHAQTIGQHFAAGIRALAAKHACIKEVRGLGLLLGVELDKPARPVADALRETGLLCIPTGENVLRFLPPLIVQENHIAIALDRLDRAL